MLMASTNVEHRVSAKKQNTYLIFSSDSDSSRDPSPPNKGPSSAGGKPDPEAMSYPRSHTPAIKREYEIDEQGNLNKTEQPAEKRAKLFSQIQAQGGVDNTPRRIRSADDLNESELKECFKIVDSAIKATSKDYQASPAVMEAFLYDVFNKWKPSSPFDVNDLNPLPVKDHYSFATPWVGRYPACRIIPRHP